MHLSENTIMNRARVRWQSYQSNIQIILGRWALVAAVLLVMVPRLLAPSFGLLDDGQMLRVARLVLAGDYYYPFIITQQQGRFFPIYWYYFVPGYALWGDSALGFYILNVVSLTVTVLSLSRVVQLISRSYLAGFIAGLLFVLASPIVENYYTISKSEPILSLCLSLSILLLVTAAQAHVQRRQLLFSASLLFLLLAYLTKETALVMIPITVSWAIGYGRAYRGDPTGRGGARMLIWYSAANLGCAAGSRWLAGIFGVSSLATGAYSQRYRLSLEVMARSLNSEILLLTRGLGFLPGLLIALALLAVWGRHVFTESKLHWALGAAAVWTGGWLAVLLPWNIVQEYYLLPASLGLCAAGGIVAELLRRFWSLRYATRPAPRLTSLALALCSLSAVVLMGCSLVNFSSNGRIQIALDRQSMAMVDALARIAPRRSTVLFNLASGSEYVFESEVYLHLFRERPDVRIASVSTESLGQLDSNTLVVTLHIRNPSVQAVRIGGFGPTVEQWNSTLLALIGPSADRVYHGVEVIPLTWVTTNEWLCWPLVALGDWSGWHPSERLCPRPPMVRGETVEFGWDIYALRAPASTSRNRVPIGVFRPETATWHLRTAASTTTEERSIHFGQPGNVPVIGDWDGNGVQGIGVYDPLTGEWALDDDLDSRADHKVRWPEMRPGDVPVVGDWDGDGVTTIGFFRPRDVSWHLRNSNSAGAEDISVFRFGLPTDIPLTGDWDGDGVTTVGIYRPTTGVVRLRNTLDSAEQADVTYKLAAHALPVVTAWRAHTPATVSTFVEGVWRLRYSACQCLPSEPLGPIDIIFGQGGDLPVSGDWGG